MSSTIILTNQFGEQTTNSIDGGTNPVSAPVAAGTVLSNLSGSSANIAANTLLAVANKAPAKTAVTAVATLATADAAAQSASYVQADVQTIATLANALKVQVNAILAALKTVA